MADLEVEITIEAGLQEETITEVDHLVGDIAEADPRVGDVVDVLDDYYCSFKLQTSVTNMPTLFKIY